MTTELKLKDREFEVVEMYLSGSSPQRIAHAIGCSRTAVRSVLCAEDIPLRTRSESGKLGMAFRTLPEGERKRRQSGHYKTWALNNHDHLRSYQKEWRTENKEALADSQREYRRANRRRLNDARNQWRRDNPQKFKAAKARRRALEKSAVGSISEEEWSSKVALHGGRCAYCRKPLVEVTQDHVVPLSKGGSHSIDNVVPACRSCNSRKGDRDAMVPVQVQEK